MLLFIALLWGGLGLIVGSFTNVLILRHNSGGTILGRSACPQCHTQLQWFELVPVMSWVILGGKCRTCAQRISLQYPVVEITVAALFLNIGLSPTPLIVRLIGSVIVVLLVAIAVYDLYYTLMPDVWVWTFDVLTFLSIFVFPLQTTNHILQSILAGPLIALPLAALWFFSKGEWMGFGDVKFALGMGWLLGIYEGYIALTLSFIIGALVGVCILLPLERIVKIFTKSGITWWRIPTQGFTMKSEVPFGPFLVCGLILVWLSMLYHYNLPGLLEHLLYWS